jgi:hypothetical protein
VRRRSFPDFRSLPRKKTRRQPRNAETTATRQAVAVTVGSILECWTARGQAKIAASLRFTRIPKRLSVRSRFNQFVWRAACEAEFLRRLEESKEVRELLGQIKDVYYAHMVVGTVYWLFKRTQGLPAAYETSSGLRLKALGALRAKRFRARSAYRRAGGTVEHAEHRERKPGRLGLHRATGVRVRRTFCVMLADLTYEAAERRPWRLTNSLLKQFSATPNRESPETTRRLVRLWRPRLAAHVERARKEIGHIQLPLAPHIERQQRGTTEGGVSAADQGLLREAWTIYMTKLRRRPTHWIRPAFR